MFGKIVLVILQVFDGNTETDKTFKFKTGKGKVIKVWHVFADLLIHLPASNFYVSPSDSLFPLMLLSVHPLHYMCMLLFLFYVVLISFS